MTKQKLILFLSFFLFFLFCGSFLSLSYFKAYAASSTLDIQMGIGEDEFNIVTPMDGTYTVYKNWALWGTNEANFNDGVDLTTGVNLKNSDGYNFSSWPTVTNLDQPPAVITPGGVDEEGLISQASPFNRAAPYPFTDGVSTGQIYLQERPGISCMSMLYLFSVGINNHVSGDNYRYVMCRNAGHAPCTSSDQEIARGSGNKFLILSNSYNYRQDTINSLSGTTVASAYTVSSWGNDEHYTINVVRCTPRIECPTYPGYPGGTEPNGDCTRRTCPVPTTPTPTTSTSSLTASISGPISLLVGNSGTYTVNATPANGASLTQGMILTAKTNQPSLPSTWGCASDTYNPWCLLGTAINPISSFSYSWTPTATGTYYVTANVWDSLGNKCSGNPFGIPAGWTHCNPNPLLESLTVNVSNVPALGTLQISPSGRSGAVPSGTYGKSGLRADPGQRGSNWYNALTVRQNITNGDADNYDLAGVVFTSSSSRPAADSNLYTLRQSAINNNGFIIVYANCSGNATCTEDGKTFNAGKYYAYYSGIPTSDHWYEGIPVSTLQTPKNPYTLTEQIGFVIYDDETSTNHPTFTVYLYNGLGSRTWGTYGYLKYGSTTTPTTKSQSLTPSQ